MAWNAAKLFDVIRGSNWTLRKWISAGARKTSIMVFFGYLSHETLL